MSIHEVLEGTREMRRGEGITFTLTTTNWASSPTSSAISIIKLSDDSDVTADWTETATPTESGDVITLPEITVPSDAAYGEYLVNIPFTAGGFAEGIPYVILRVIKPRGS